MRDIFVFGSNLAGRHGKGAALYAAKNFGAERGVGEGETGDSYAIPTKDESLEALPLAAVEGAITRFINHARGNQNNRYFLTPVGTGLAGLNKRDIWRILAKEGPPSNVYLTSSWLE